MISLQSSNCKWGSFFEFRVYLYEVALITVSCSDAVFTVTCSDHCHLQWLLSPTVITATCSEKWILSPAVITVSNSDYCHLQWSLPLIALITATRYKYNVDANNSSICKFSLELVTSTIINICSDAVITATCSDHCITENGSDAVITATSYKYTLMSEKFPHLQLQPSADKILKRSKLLFEYVIC